MRIITHTCEECGTVVAANELEHHRVMKCPRISCENILRFEDLNPEDRKFFIDNAADYRM